MKIAPVEVFPIRLPLKAVLTKPRSGNSHGFPPGGSTDLAARLLAARLTQTLGQSFLVENRAGASGNVAGRRFGRG